MSDSLDIWYNELSFAQATRGSIWHLAPKRQAEKNFINKYYNFTKKAAPETIDKNINLSVIVDLPAFILYISIFKKKLS